MGAYVYSIKAVKLHLTYRAAASIEQCTMNTTTVLEKSRFDFPPLYIYIVSQSENSSDTNSNKMIWDFKHDFIYKHCPEDTYS